MIEIEAPDGSVVEFPDGTTDAVIESAMRAAFPPKTPKVAPRASQADVRAREPNPPARDPRLSAVLDAAAPFAQGFLSGGPLGVAKVGIGKALDGVNEVIYEAGGAATDSAVALGASPEVAAGVGTAVNLAGNLVGGPQSKAKQLANVVKSRASLAATPAAERAVAELAKRSEALVTPGQVAGEAGFGERVARAVNPGKFQKAGEEVTNAAELLRQDTVNPSVQPKAKALGQRILDAADEVQKAVKTRLRPTFEAADALNVQVDFTAVRATAQQALAKHRAGLGTLGKTEVTDLEELVAKLGGTSQMTNPRVSAEVALDFIGGQKAKLRETPEYKPSGYYSTIVGMLTKDADSAFVVAARQAPGGGRVVQDLLLARNDYKEMMGTIYDDAVKTAMKKNPEDIGRHFWQAGNVSEVEQLQQMLVIAQREGKMTRGDAAKLQRDMTRGFLQEAVQDIGAAAKWSQTLKSDSLKRRTWEAFTDGPGGQQLRDGMKVLEEASKIAQRGQSELLGQNAILISRIAAGGLGVSYVSAVINPGVAIAGISATVAARMMATAYTQGNTGVIRTLARVLRANGVKTIAGARAVQAGLPELEEFAAKNGINDLFVFEEKQ